MGELEPVGGQFVQWQFFGGMQYYEPRLPRGATQIGRFRRVLGEAGVEELLKPASAGRGREHEGRASE